MPVVEQLLSTKFYIPLTRPDLVPRPRLIELLNTDLCQSQGFGRKLTLISAPAGFGKTTLVAEWVKSIRVSVEGSVNTLHSTCNLHPLVAWLSLDEGDNDLVRFLTYLIVALHRVEGFDTKIGEKGLNKLQASHLPQIESLLTSLINEIAASSVRIILVLDDYHLIEAQFIHDTLAFLLEHLPPQMHLIIATREDPYLPLARLRARCQSIELRAAHLRFTSSEAAAFLNQVMGLGLSGEDITALEDRTEGWIAGLQLAAVSLLGQPDKSRLIRSFTGSHRFVLDYLIEDVLSQQSGSLQDFLLQSSILKQLTGPLCDAVCFGSAKTPTGQATLEMLERANLFIVPLDNERQWYRYHHLFADLLRQRLHQTQPELQPILHLRASEWYENNGFTAQAIEHSVRAEDFDRAAVLAELAWPEMHMSYKGVTWLGWVDAIPDQLIRARPVLSTGIGWSLDRFRRFGGRRPPPAEC